MLVSNNTSYWRDHLLEGTYVEIINAGEGAYGINGKSGVISYDPDKYTENFLCGANPNGNPDVPKILVEGNYWRIGLEWELRVCKNYTMDGVEFEHKTTRSK